MDERARGLLRDFTREKLNGDLDGIRTFNFKTLRGDDKFGCPGRYFDCDDTEIARAVYVILWEDSMPGLSMDTLGNTEKYRGDTMNSFHTMFGREIPERPGFYAGLEKYDPDDAMRERVREFGNKYCSTIGNFTVLPNYYVQNTTLNYYRGTNQWRDFFDRFLIELGNVLCDRGEKDPLLKELVHANAFCFDKFKGEKGFRALTELLFLGDYWGDQPEIIFPMNYHWKDPSDRKTYLADAEKYLAKAEAVIENRGHEILLALKRSKVNLVWKEGERTWVDDHWEFKKGCSPLCKCLELANHDLSKAMDLCHQWRIENIPDDEIGYCCTNNEYETELEEEWVRDRMKVYGLTKEDLEKKNHKKI